MRNRNASRRNRLITTVAGTVAACAVFASYGGISFASGVINLAQYQYGKKVTICHKGKVTITVSVNAWPAHKRHGDTLGPCPPKGSQQTTAGTKGSGGKGNKGNGASGTNGNSGKGKSGQGKSGQGKGRGKSGKGAGSSAGTGSSSGGSSSSTNSGNSGKGNGQGNGENGNGKGKNA
jgi:hypothetical protein